jgi:hypothetical protein
VKKGLDKARGQWRKRMKKHIEQARKDEQRPRSDRKRKS